MKYIPRSYVWNVLLFGMLVLGFGNASVLWAASNSQEVPVLREKSESLLAQVNGLTVVDDSLSVSPDSRRIAYAAREGDKLFVIVDGKEGERYDDVDVPIFSSDSKHFAHAVQVDDEWFVIVDGKAGGRYNGVGGLTFSPDGKRLAYVAQADNELFIVVDGEAGDSYNGILGSGAIFSPDGKRLAYAARAGDEMLVIIDGEAGARYDGLKSDPIFSPDSKRIAYAAQVGDEEFVVVDDEAGARYDSLQSDPVFSPDGERLAYVATDGDEWFVVVNGETGARYDNIGGLTFSPDGERLAYVVQAGDKWRVVVDDEVGDAYDGIADSGPIFSPDGKRLAYGAQAGDQQFVIVDGEAGDSYDGIGDRTLTFSPDGMHLAYTAKADDKWFMVVDGETGARYDRMDDPVFSPDGKHLAYAAHADDKWFVVVNGEKGDPYDLMVIGSDLVFDSPDMFHYMAGNLDSTFLEIYSVVESLLSSAPNSTTDPIPTPIATSTASSAPTTETQVGLFATVQVSSLNVRSGPGVGFSIQGVVRRGDVLPVVGESGNCSWLEVTTSDGATGWVSGAPQHTLLDGDCNAVATPTTLSEATPIAASTPASRAVNPAPAPNATNTSTSASTVVAPTPTPTALATPLADAEVNSSALNMREGPGTNYPILASLQRGDPLEVIGQSADCTWLEVVTSAGKAGWISGAAQYVTLNLPCADLPLGEVRPLTGQIKRYVGSSGLGELTIKNGTDGDGVVILTNTSGAPAIAAYVRSGDSYRMTGIADGSYQIYFSKGGKWDDGAKVFTQNVSRQRFDDVFPFETTATTYSIWQVTLYGVTDGNASSSHVPAEQFPELP